MDPNFAMAYARLSVAYTNISEQSLSATNITKAFEVRERTTEKEKLYISGHYYRQVTGDLPKAIEAFTILSRTYPRESDPHENLSAIFSYVGRNDEALAEALESLRLDPGNGGSYINCATLYCSLNQFEKMRAALHAAEAAGLKSDPSPQILYVLGFLTNNAAEMKRQVEISGGKPGSQEMFQLQSDTEAYLGRLEEARVYTKRAMDSAREASGGEQANFFKLIGSLHESEVGYQQRGLQEVRSVSVSDKDLLIVQAMALARAGDGSHARSITDNLDKQYPSDTTVQYYWLPTIRSAIELEAGNPEQAIQLLQPAEQYELGAPMPFFGPMYPIYLRGLACLKAGRGQEASREFQKILAHKGIGANFVTSALSQLQLGRALAMSGDSKNARDAYLRFFDTWKDADTGVPILTQAKAEYSSMN